MSQAEVVHGLLEAFFAERQRRPSLDAFVKRAEAAGAQQLAKILRAVIASDDYRDRLMRTGLPEHAFSSVDFFVCPHCGLIYESEAPERCLIDETRAAQFEHIG